MYSILLVDDFKPNLRLLEETFRDAEFQVESASSVEEAEEVLSRKAFDLVLSDIQMPGATGFDLLAWIQHQGMHDLPVLFITSALPEAEHRIQGLSLGAVDYVLRSLDPDELVLRVKKAIGNVRELRRLKISLEDSEKLASLGRIIAASNHEIKNLAHIVRMSAEAIARKNQEKDEEKIILLNAATMLADVTRSMNQLLKDEPAFTQTVDLGDVARQMVFMAKTLLKGIAVESAFDTQQKYWVSASPVSLKQVLLNLLMNARDAIQENAENAGLIRISIQREGDQCRLDLKDNGVGLPVAQVQSEFPAFSSTKRLRGGTGLGLWLSARLLKAMHGYMHLASDGPGRGAAATVYLKAAEAPKADLDLSDYLRDL